MVVWVFKEGKDKTSDRGNNGTQGGLDQSSNPQSIFTALPQPFQEKPPLKIGALPPLQPL